MSHKPNRAQMPVPPSVEAQKAQVADEMPALPVADESPAAALEAAVEAAPEMMKSHSIESGPKNDSIRHVKLHKKGIEVITIRDGYYKQSRKFPGERFLISDMSEIGSWMRLADPKAEELRQKEIKLKAAAAKLKGKNQSAE